VLDHSPHTTPSAENTFRTRGGESAHIGGITIGRNPSLRLGATTGRQSETEEVQNRSKVAVFLNVKGAPGDRVMQWDYSIDDKQEQQSGRTFEHPPPPRVKLGFELLNKPYLEIDVLDHAYRYYYNAAFWLFPIILFQRKGTCICTGICKSPPASLDFDTAGEPER